MTYTWNIGGTSTTSTTNTFTTTAMTATTTYTVQLKNSNGYTGPVSAEGTITVNPLPTFTDVTANPTPICKGGSTTLTATASGAASFSFDNSSNWQTGNSKVDSPTSTTTYTVKVRSSAGCEAAAAKTVEVTVNTPPTAPTALTSSAASVCTTGTTLTLTATAGVGSGAVYEWGTGAVGNNTMGTSTVATYSVSTNAATTYWVRMIGTGACSATTTGGSTVSITANTPPTAPTALNSSTTTICNGTTTSMTLTASGGSAGSGAVYEWGRGAVGNNILGTSTAATYSASTNAASTYWVRMKGTGACSATTTGGVTRAIGVYSAISAGAISGGSATVTAGTNPGATITNSSSATGGNGSITYEWRRTGTSSATFTSSNSTTYNIGSDATNYSTVGTYYFKRYAHDGCNTAWKESSGSYTLTVNPPCTGCVLWETCSYEGFTYISNTSSEGLMHWSTAEAHCSSKGMQLPTIPQLTCMCNNKGGLPNSYEANYYWSNMPYPYETGHYNDIKFTNCIMDHNGGTGSNNRNYVRCVK
jgi:hypothetical protein